MIEVHPYVNTQNDPHRWVVFGDVSTDEFLEALDALHALAGRPDRVRHSWGVKHASTKFDHTLSSHLTPRPAAEPITWISHAFTLPAAEFV